jgi:hypothetical protein
MTEPDRNFSPEYPAPPQVRWGVLLAVQIGAQMICQGIFHFNLLAKFAFTAVDCAWIIYLCLWIRKLDPKSTSLPFAFILTAMEFVFVALFDVKNPSSIFTWRIGGIWVVSCALWIGFVFLIRAELLKHYNEREPIGLKLGLVKTFFFSYFYFQYHLYKIALSKKRHAGGLIENPSGTLLP